MRIFLFVVTLVISSSVAQAQTVTLALVDSMARNILGCSLRPESRLFYLNIKKTVSATELDMIQQKSSGYSVCVDASDTLIQNIHNSILGCSAKPDSLLFFRTAKKKEPLIRADILGLKNSTNPYTTCVLLSEAAIQTIHHSILGCYARTDSVHFFRTSKVTPIRIRTDIEGLKADGNRSTCRTCVPNQVQVCGTIPNGTYSKSCSPTGSAWGACGKKCNSGFGLNTAGLCQRQICTPGAKVSCGAISGGTNIKTCATNGLSYGFCVKDCAKGYYLSSAADTCRAFPAGFFEPLARPPPAPMTPESLGMTPTTDIYTQYNMPTAKLAVLATRFPYEVGKFCSQVQSAARKFYEESAYRYKDQYLQPPPNSQLAHILGSNNILGLDFNPQFFSIKPDSEYQDYLRWSRSTVQGRDARSYLPKYEEDMRAFWVTRHQATEKQFMKILLDYRYYYAVFRVRCPNTMNLPHYNFFPGSCRMLGAKYPNLRPGWYTIWPYGQAATTKPPATKLAGKLVYCSFKQ